MRKPSEWVQHDNLKHEIQNVWKLTAIPPKTWVQYVLALVEVGERERSTTALIPTALLGLVLGVRFPAAACCVKSTQQCCLLYQNSTPKNAYAMKKRITEYKRIY